LQNNNSIRGEDEPNGGEHGTRTQNANSFVIMGPRCSLNSTRTTTTSKTVTSGSEEHMKNPRVCLWTIFFHVCFSSLCPVRSL
jgi:hypothetical protein